MKAIIDIGSNSVRLLLVRADGTFYKRINTTRLGEGLAAAGRLRPEAIERTAQAVAGFAAEGRALGGEAYAFATAAVRSSENGRAFCARVKELCGLDVDVVSGAEEAMLGLFGALGDADGGILDIGGASTELCLREGGGIVFSRSLDIGAVRLFDVCGDRREALEAAIDAAIGPFEGVRPAGRVYAIGGTASTLACLKLRLGSYDGARIQDLPMTLEEIRALADELFFRTVEERRRMEGMDPRRADIIAGGTLLLEKIMEKLSLAEVFASDRDNLEGYCILRGLV